MSQARPPAKLRSMVQGVLPSLLRPIVAQLKEWTVMLRLNAARSLHSVLLLAEEAASQHLPYLVGPLSSAAGDEDPQVALCVVQAAQVYCRTSCTAINCHLLAIVSPSRGCLLD